MNRKGFFISIDLIITLATVILLFGLLGAYLHEGIQDYANYKEDIKMQSTMNIVMNRLADSNYSCDLYSNNDEIIKKVSFCIPFGNNIKGLFSDLDYNISMGCYSCFKGACSFAGCFGYAPLDPSKSSNYIAKDIYLMAPKAKGLAKYNYLNCFLNKCTDISGNDINTLVRVYVWK